MDLLEIIKDLLINVLIKLTHVLVYKIKLLLLNEYGFISGQRLKLCDYIYTFTQHNE